MINLRYLKFSFPSLRTASYLENGIETHIYRLSLVLVQNCDSQKYIFESLAKFKDQNTRFFPINFDFLKTVFEILLAVLAEWE